MDKYPVMGHFMYFVAIQDVVVRKGALCIIYSHLSCPVHSPFIDLTVMDCFY